MEAPQTEHEEWFCPVEAGIDNRFALSQRFLGVSAKNGRPEIKTVATKQQCFSGHLPPKKESGTKQTLGLNTIEFPSPHLVCGAHRNEAPGGQPDVNGDLVWSHPSKGVCRAYRGVLCARLFRHSCDML